MLSIIQNCKNIGSSGNSLALCSRTQVMSFGRILRRAATSRTEAQERQLLNDMKALRESVAAYNQQIPELSELKQIESLKRLNRDSPPDCTIATAIGQRRLEIIGLNIAMGQHSAEPDLADALQQSEQKPEQEHVPEYMSYSCHTTPTDDPGPDSRTVQAEATNSTGSVDHQLPDVVPHHSASHQRQMGNTDPVTADIFQCRENNLELKLADRFGCYIIDANFSPTAKSLFIKGSDGDDDYRLDIWQQGADGTWLQEVKVADSASFYHYELNRSEDTLLTSSYSGNVKVSTLNSDGCWEEVVVLALTPYHEDYPPLQVTFSPLQDKIMAYDHQASSIIVLRKENGQWVLLTQPPISHYQQTGPAQPYFKATDHYLLAYQGKTVTIWGFSDKGNYLEKKGVFECDRRIASAQLSDDERNAVIFTWGSQALFLGCDDDGNWSQVGKIVHPEKWISDENQVHTNLISRAAFNISGQHALTHDTGDKVIISGYDDSGAWVRKAEIQDCPEARFSPSGDKLLARLGSSGLFRFWDCIRTGDPLGNGQALEHIGSRKAIFSPSENRLLSYGDKSDVACIWGNDGEGNLVKDARVYHQGGVDYAEFNAQEDSVLTYGHDLTLKIHALDSVGRWQQHLVARHQNSILDARFSHSGRLAYSVGLDDTACILGRDANGQWVQQAVTGADGYSIDGADFNGLDNHFLTYGNKRYRYDKHQPGLVQLWGIGDDGQWVIIDQIKLDHSVQQARFSPDSEHLVINCNDIRRGPLLSAAGTALLWKIPVRAGQETAHV